MSKRYLTIHEKWEQDALAYQNGAKVEFASPQCFDCKNFIKGNALNCKAYVTETKPQDVFFSEAECDKFETVEPIKLNISDDKQSKLFGGILGFCIGDMLGVPVEFTSRQELDAEPVTKLRAYGTYNQPFGCWSDDTSLMLCLIDALLKENVTEQLKNNMISYYTKGYFTPQGKMFDIGNSTRSAIQNMIDGVNPIKCGGATEYDNGNGSLMRILPIAYIADRMTEDELIKFVSDISSFTHRHPRSVVACIFYVVFAAQLNRGLNMIEAFESASAFVRKNCDSSSSGELRCYENIFNKAILTAERRAIKSTGYVVDTLEAVVWTLFNTKSYKEAVLTAVNLGGDTDTIAALTGGLAGIYYGAENIPDLWIQNIKKKDYICAMISQFEEIINK